ncbi:MAG: hypothetical protein NXI20_17140 [bacterium]|nr:hypothetical protein [bacterium]
MKPQRIFILILLLSITSFAQAQRFDQKILVKKVIYSPEGQFAYIAAEEPTKTLYKWDIEKSAIVEQWDIPITNIFMYFVGDDIYMDLGISQESDGLMKLNTSTNQFELYHQNRKGEQYRLMGICENGDLYLFEILDYRTREYQAWGPLFIYNPTTKSNVKTIGTTTSGTVYTSTPVFQPNVQNKVFFLDFGKEKFDKSKFKLYDINTEKSVTVEKAEYGNFVLHGFQDLYVFEYYSKSSDASKYKFYNKQGEEIASHDWYVYKSMLHDKAKNELYLLRGDDKGIDVLSTKTGNKIRSAKVFDDFFKRKSQYDDAAEHGINNGKKYRFHEEYGDMGELIGYFEIFNFESGKYEKIGELLREGYSFEEYEELKVMAKQMSEEREKEAAIANKARFKSDLSYMQYLPTSGNRETFEALGKDMNGGSTWQVAQTASYSQLATNIAKIAECDEKVVVLVRATEYEQKLQGDYLNARDETNFYLSIVNRFGQYESIKMVGQDVYVTKTNKHTAKVENSGLLSNATRLSWTDHGDTFWVSGNKGNYTIEKAGCSFQ